MPTLQEDFAGGSLDDLGEDFEVAVVDFGATWCSPCKRQRPIFERVARWFQEHRGDAPLAFLTVDVDDNQGLPTRFHVKSVPTTLVARREEGLLWGHAWREKKRFQGIVPFEKLREAVQDVLSGE